MADVMADVEADVLVAGGGLAGLAAAALLALHGTRVVVAERRPTTSLHPKARLVNVRSMEIYRALGVERDVLEAGEPNAGFVVADTLAGEHATWVAPPPEETSAADDVSPCRPYSCDQQRIEPILLRRAAELGADLRLATAVEGLVVGGDGVSARLCGKGGAATVRARYAIAADGARSALRRQLGIGMHGEPVAGTAVSALFRADLGRALRGRHVDAILCRSAEAFLFARGSPADRTWQLGTHLRPGWDGAALPGHLRDVVRAATGLPDLRPAIESVQTWTTGAWVADRFRHGRLFLIGDAAHVMPPYGGFGGNTGVADAHNLAWKLAAACRGAEPAGLLDTYQSERLPIAELTVAQALLRSRKTPGRPAPPDQVDATALVLGFRYPPAAGAPVEDPAAPSGEPGTRAPHVGLTDGRSLLDLFDPTAHTLVADGEVSRADVLPGHRARWDAVYAGRRVLVRPDGVIASVSSPGSG
ncbi:FAD-dependent oxidoreductase [Pseudonocardia adelaidensis]|uniref:FAD-dependent oxidoreductase n=2 Tax=Pseudonocardia adelaidensis TaxID=648754 RepID=A0ABP9N972_9PSEU